LARCFFSADKAGGDCWYKNQYDEVHVDEKWFSMVQDNKWFILGVSENDPVCTTCHKGHIDKVMFLSAVARPWWDVNFNLLFDGKIGFGPVAQRIALPRNAKYRKVLSSRNVGVDGCGIE
jgi:hypothetical protein